MVSYLKNKYELKYKREKKNRKIARALSELPTKWLNRPGQLAGDSERARGIFFTNYQFCKFQSLV